MSIVLRNDYRKEEDYYEEHSSDTLNPFRFENTETEEEI